LASLDLEAISDRLLPFAKSSLGSISVSRERQQSARSGHLQPRKSETQAGMGYRSDLETDLYSWRKNCGFTFLVLRVHDNPKFSGRNRAWHEAWITEQTATVLRFDGMNSAEKMAAKVIHALS
jgi:hypothetical protein